MTGSLNLPYCETLRTNASGAEPALIIASFPKRKQLADSQLLPLYSKTGTVDLLRT